TPRALRLRPLSIQTTSCGGQRSGAKAEKPSSRRWPACRAYPPDFDHLPSFRPAQPDTNGDNRMNTSIAGVAGTIAHMAPSPAAEMAKPSITRKAVAAAIAGNALEFYDFVLYA